MAKRSPDHSRDDTQKLDNKSRADKIVEATDGSNLSAEKGEINKASEVLMDNDRAVLKSTL